MCQHTSFFLVGGEIHITGSCIVVPSVRICEDFHWISSNNDLNILSFWTTCGNQRHRLIWDRSVIDGGDGLVHLLPACMSELWHDLDFCINWSQNVFWPSCKSEQSTNTVCLDSQRTNHSMTQERPLWPVVNNWCLVFQKCPDGPWCVHVSTVTERVTHPGCVCPVETTESTEKTNPGVSAKDSRELWIRLTILLTLSKTNTNRVGGRTPRMKPLLVQEKHHCMFEVDANQHLLLPLPQHHCQDVPTCEPHPNCDIILEGASWFGAALDDGLPS